MKRRTSELLLVVAFASFVGVATVASAAPGDPYTSFGIGGMRVIEGTVPADDGTLHFRRIVLQPDGKLLVVGTNFVDRIVVRLTSNGDFDSTYGSAGYARVTANPHVFDAVLQSDGRLILGSHDAISRIDGVGSLDMTFGSAGTVAVGGGALALESGRFLAGEGTALQRFLPNGQTDTSFGFSGAMQLPIGIWPRALVFDAEQRVLAAGESYAIGVYLRRQRAGRILPNGSLDVQFGTNGSQETSLPATYGNTHTQSAVLDSAGRLLVAAEIEVTCGAAMCNTLIVQRLLPTGSLDTSFGTNGLVALGPANYSLSGGQLALQPDGKILLAGFGSLQVGSFNEVVLVRLAPDGQLDSSFGQGGFSFRDLPSTVPDGLLAATPTGFAVRPDGVAFATAVLPGNVYIGVGDGAVSSFLLNDANDDGAPEAWDLTPDAVSFTSQAAVPVGTVRTSNVIDVTGLGASVSVPVSITNGEYAINGSTTYRRGVSWVANGDRINVRHTASASNATSVVSEVTIGGWLAGNNSVVRLGTPTVAQFTSTTAAGSPGQLSLVAGSAFVSEGAGSVTLTVRRTGGTAGAVSVGFMTTSGSATSGSDFMATLGTAQWSDGDAADKTISVAIVSDNVDEPNETFTVGLLAATGGATLGATTQATVTIVDDDPTPGQAAGVLAFSTTTAGVAEAAGSITLTVTRTGGSSGLVTAQFATAAGTASAGSDFDATSNVLTWNDGDATNKTITVTVASDSVDEPDETLTVTLSSPTGGATLGSAVVTVTIVDDDPAPGSGGGGGGGGGQTTPPPATSSGGGGGGGAVGVWLLPLLAALLARRRSRAAGQERGLLR